MSNVNQHHPVDRIEREIEEGIRRRMAEREEYITKHNEEYRKVCEEIEDQILSYVNLYVEGIMKKLAISAAIIACVFLVFHGSLAYGVTVLATVGAYLLILNWREKRRRKRWFVKVRKSCTEPTFRDRNLSLALGDENTWAYEKDAEEMRDEIRRLIIREEMRFFNRYRQAP
jgi:hypothetical protein